MNPHAFALERIKNTASIYEFQCSVINPCFDLSAGQEIIVMSGLEPKINDIVLVLLYGKRKLAKYQGAKVELPDGSITPFSELIGLVIL